mmetsp:Transcript_107361/g.342238  ORF Transcript_107361/g.342238 Transcript_107361/m.342238 type:complete len:266 (+) Transcript_107361:73-870(+)
MPRFVAKKRPAAKKLAADRGRGKQSVGRPSAKCHFCVGTSGFQYPHWRGNFYPEGVRTGQEFEHYAKHFNAVELNTTFYGTPSASTVDAWQRRAGNVSKTKPFLYCLKANQFFTHRKQLVVDGVFKARWLEFWSRCEALGEHLGCVLFQFSPRFKLTKSGEGTSGTPRPTLQRLTDLGALLPKEGRFAFEFRHPSWFGDPDVIAVFQRFNWCFSLVDCCNVDGWAGDLASGSSPSPDSYPLTCDWGVYFRFHGLSGQYVGVHFVV